MAQRSFASSSMAVASPLVASEPPRAASGGCKGFGRGRADVAHGCRRIRRAVFCDGTDWGRCSKPPILLIVIIVVADVRLWL